MMGEGTVNDEELVEVIAKAIAHEWDTNGTGTFIPAMVFAIVARDALRSAGFQVFKPENAKSLDVVADPEPGIDRYGEPYQREPRIESHVIEPGSRCLLNPGTYHLVPADSGGSG